MEPDHLVLDSKLGEDRVSKGRKAKELIVQRISKIFMK